MKIAYFTSMYPTKNAPNGGVFITKRMEIIITKNIEYGLYAIVYYDSKLVETIRTFFNINYRNNEVDPVIKSPNSDISYDPIYIKMGLIAFILNKITGYRYQAYLTFKSARKKVRLNNYDLIHCHWVHPTGTGILKFAELFQIPFVVTCHGSDINVLLEKKSMRKTIIKTLEQATRVEFVSKALRDKAKSYGYSSNNSTIVPNGIDPVMYGNNILRKERKNKIIGFVGNLIEIKRADKLAEIINIVNERTNLQVEFYIIGDGPLRDKINKNIQENNVRFFGRVEHKRVLELMAEMDLLLLPSRNEGWPCVVLEAFSVGTPVLGSSNGGIPEAIDNVNFIVTEENFVEDYTNKVIDFINGKIPFNRTELIDRATNYSWNRLVDLSIKEYNDIILERDGLL